MNGERESGWWRVEVGGEVRERWGKRGRGGMRVVEWFRRDGIVVIELNLR